MLQIDQHYQHDQTRAKEFRFVYWDIVNASVSLTRKPPTMNTR